eukprot:TRINITY_DN3388_c0_g1_i4.p1 TRINITY_DN3388_c0_g1~~TRINITY_DN3388_c0_g1_i4.p1  ORF type:complete len:493 (-),score=116.69 TRINITY_DN3388_c0_g1_i4:131-1609(-)
MQRLLCRYFSFKIKSKVSTAIYPKFYTSGYEALKDVQDGASICYAGFGVAGVAENCLRIVCERKLKNLVLQSNSMGLPGWGPGALLEAGQVSKVVACFIGGNPAAEKQYLEGKVGIRYMPQGSLAEGFRMRQAGLGGFFSPAGVATPIEYGNSPLKLREDGTPEEVSKGLPKKTFNGKEYLMYPAFEQADFCFIKAYVADKYGNLRYKRSARNFNPDMAGCAKVTVAEAEYIVDRLPVDKIHTPGCFVDRIFEGEIFTHKIERLRLRSDESAPSTSLTTRQKISKRAALEFRPGMFINLGVGMPVEVLPYLSHDCGVIFHAENGLVGAGDYPTFDEIDPDTINASKEPVTVQPGFSLSGSCESFGMMRGGHIHMTVLGGMQVSEKGDLANWMVPGKSARGMGGAMDLAAGCPQVMVMMEHCVKGQPRILGACTYPLTAKQCVTIVITEFAVFEIVKGRMILKEKDKGISLEALKKITPANYTVDPNLKDYAS